ncbi:hypothetical protein EV421DRAFT_1867844 [Armillaria borealis]|uniref:Uncharacterized protein n=1 Tax=Armillaria borealis TaxID=47425 RepID=A0AA39IES8_9AGAR|nr:hypothetical protein EV421DRAFT_1867844 [Armillaria borealis]
MKKAFWVKRLGIFVHPTCTLYAVRLVSQPLSSSVLSSFALLEYSSTIHVGHQYTQTDFDASYENDYEAPTAPFLSRYVSWSTGLY